MVNYRYPLTIQDKGEGGLIGRFRDVPEAVTESEDLRHLKVEALDALIAAIEFYIEEGRSFPAPSRLERGESAVELPPSVILKVMLLNAMVEDNIRPADLARKMGIKPQEVTRITNIRHVTKIDTLQKAFNALGKELVFKVQPRKSKSIL